VETKGLREPAPQMSQSDHERPMNVTKFTLTARQEAAGRGFCATPGSHFRRNVCAMEGAG